MGRKTKIKFTDFECNLLINGMNEFRNMLLAENLPTDDVDELLLKIILCKVSFISTVLKLRGRLVICFLIHIYSSFFSV